MNHCMVVVAAALMVAPLISQAEAVSGESRQRPSQERHASRDMLQNADKNGDNLISREEAKAVPWLNNRFDALDSNQGGQISREEIAAAKSAHHAKRRRKAEEKFNQADTDQDGGLSREEAAKGLPGIVGKFDVIDVSQDGKITHSLLPGESGAGW